MRKDLEPSVGDLLKYVAGEIKAAAAGEMSPTIPPQQRRQQALVRMLRSGDEPVQWIAIKELGQIGDAEVAGELMPFMTSPNDDLRSAARDALAQIENRTGVGERVPLPPAPLPPTPVVAPRSKPGMGAPRARAEMPVAVETEVDRRARRYGTTPSDDESSQSTFTPLTSVARGQAKPGTGAPRVRLEMPASVETEREVRARRSDSTLSQDRRAQEFGRPGAEALAPEERRTAGDDLLPMLINRERTALPMRAEAAPTSASIPPPAALSDDVPPIPAAADLPPA